MFAGSYAYDNQGMQQSETAQNHSQDNTVSFLGVFHLWRSLGKTVGQLIAFMLFKTQSLFLQFSVL